MKRRRVNRIMGTMLREVTPGTRVSSMFMDAS